MYECITHVYMLTHVRINDGKIALHVACVSCDGSVPLCVCMLRVMQTTGTVNQHDREDHKSEWTQ